MLFNTVLVSSFLVALSSTVSASKQINIVVGGKGEHALKFSPSYVQADVGDVLLFTLEPGSNSVTQSSFTKPCQALPGGLDTGLTEVSEDEEDYPYFEVEIKDKKPMFFFSSGPGQCQAGEVFAVNAKMEGGHSFKNFYDNAIHSGPQVHPGHKREYNYPPQIVREAEA